MEPQPNKDNQVPYHHKIEPSEITTSDDDTDDGQTMRSKRKKPTGPKKQPTRKPIQLKTFAHQFFLQQKELCGFRGKTNETFVLYLLQAEEKRREYEKSQLEIGRDFEDESRTLKG
jgi:macrodomain Ter protein organizer (MatP/YcbG family)